MTTFVLATLIVRCSSRQKELNALNIVRNPSADLAMRATSSANNRITSYRDKMPTKCYEKPRGYWSIASLMRQYTLSKYVVNKLGLQGQPCFTPSRTLIGILCPCYPTNSTAKSEYMRYKDATRSRDKPTYSKRTVQSLALSTVS